MNETVDPVDAGVRVDRWLRKRFPDLPLARVHRLIRRGDVRMDRRRVQAGTRLIAGAVLRLPPTLAADSLTDPATSRARRPPLRAQQVQQVRHWLIYRDDRVLAINKPLGLASQGGTKVRWSLTDLLEGLRFECAQRPLIVHRLDRATGGVMILARDLPAARLLAKQFRTRQVQKTYWALTNRPPTRRKGTITAPIDGLAAHTDYRVLMQSARGCWLALFPRTGRMHQLRIHLAQLGCPIIGDRKYNGCKARVLHLHARRLVLTHPQGGRLSIRAGLAPSLVESWQAHGFLLHLKQPAPAS
ncbi:MAG: RluA family pseudouridine synthase [Pseudomonadota bacterium]